MKYGEMYPLSNFKPSITSNSSSKVFPSLTVITPSFPTCIKLSVKSVQIKKKRKKVSHSIVVIPQVKLLPFPWQKR